MARRLFTSESVTEGHPDKMCDQISDAVLDAMLAQDAKARVACETLATTGMVFVTGEITADAYVDIPSVVRKTVLDIGYDSAECGFDGNSCAVVTSINEQSPDIALGVNKSLEAKGGEENEFASTGAGDQGMMFGFACDETENFMPAPIYYAHKMSRKLAEVRKSGKLSYLRPDGKTQITINYDDDGKPVSTTNIVVSTQHAPDVSHEQIRRDIIEHVVKPSIPERLLNSETTYFVNPTGRFVLGGPQADVGLTGRKIIVDTYGGYASHGGGCFSGKDPTKVDRSAAYMARYVAKNIVAAGLARQCEIEVAYAIGVSQPVSVHVETYGTGVLPDKKIEEIIVSRFDLRPAAIIKTLNLRRPIFKQTASYGHFGRDDIDVSWEKTDRAEELKKDFL